MAKVYRSDPVEATLGHMSKRKILLLSAYDAVSHQHWRKGMVAAFPEYEWTVLTLPPRHFAWRIRGNSLSWAYMERKTLERGYDLIIATSMTDLSALKGMAPSLAAATSLLYFHENQFDYPLSGNEHKSVEPQIVSIYAALSATRIAFNSDYNRQTFLAGVRQLFKRLPDHVPEGIDIMLSEKSILLPVPLDESWSDLPSQRGEKFTLLWNHRWEYDKGPERLFYALCRLREAGVDFHAHIVGQQFRDAPKVFERFRDELSAHIGVWGFVEDKAEYRRLMQQSHVVLSTSLHDFQGLSILEATAAGCLPLVPDRLAYREFIPDEFRYDSYLNSEDREAEALAQSIFRLAELYGENRLPEAPDMSAMRWKVRKADYKILIESLFVG